MNNNKMLIPEYVEKFRCIGSKCENSCCKGWNISVDKSTYKKYKKIKDEELTNIIKNSLIMNKERNHNANYSKIKLDDNGLCPFLDENMLCKIQKNCGEQLLCYTCKSYPRVYNKVGETVENSCTISCPEVARLALLNPSKMSFKEVEIGKNFIYYPQKNIAQSEDMFWVVRIFTIDTIQNRNYRIWERLMILGVFFESVRKYIMDDNKEQVLKFIESFNYLLESKEISDLLDKYHTNINYQFDLMKIIYEIRMKLEIKDNVFNECMNEFYQGLMVNETLEEEQHKLFLKNYEEYFLPFIDKHEYIFENYLVQYVFTEAFPAGKGEDSFDKYCLMVLNFVLLKTLLIGMSGYHKRIDEELVIKLVHSFHRAYHHGNKSIQYVYEIIKKDKSLTLERIILLLKN